MELLPSSERQRWLIEQTARLVASCGQAQYLEAPLLEPTPAYFPEGWAPDLTGAREITRRLLDHAALGDVDMELVDFVNVMDVEGDGDEPYHHVAGFFAGIENGACRFGINVPALGDPEELSGIMAHEVAHAFRHHHALVVADREVEEELTDLTTVYLGSGVLVTNLSERVVFHPTPGAMGFSRSRAGYLPLEELSFLLAIQALSRGFSSDAIERLTKLLGSSQSLSFREATRELRARTLDLKRELGLNASVQGKGFDAKPAAPSEPDRWTRPWGRTVYRACYRHRRAGTAVGLTLGFVAMLVAETPPALGVLGLCGFGLGALVGRDRCSKCRTPLERDDRECPGCAGYILATLREPPHVFDADSKTRVRRLRGTRAGSYATWGTLFGGVLGVSLGELGDVTLGLLGTVLGMVVGGVVGRRRRRDVCSDPDCGVVLEPGLVVCPRCRGEIRGEITSEIDRL